MGANFCERNFHSSYCDKAQRRAVQTGLLKLPAFFYLCGRWIIRKKTQSLQNVKIFLYTCIWYPLPHQSKHFYRIQNTLGTHIH